MTTIAYCHKTKQIACDSRSTAGYTICSDEEIKFKKVDDEVWFFSGATADCETLIDIHKGKIKPFDISANAIVATKNGIFARGYSRNERRYMPYPINYSWAIGSGTDHALTALDMGLSAKQAVEIAMKRDTCTGGKIWVFDCATMEFIND
jgi:ATP-dependent protease HslVU (ClpYQ) peptidase subunit